MRTPSVVEWRVRARWALGAVLGAGALACQKSPPPPPPAIEAGPRVESEPLDCRTHRANPATGEVRRVTPPFARFDVENGVGVLREGGQETLRIPLGADGGAATPGAGAGIVFAHRVVALAGGRLRAFDRETGKESWGRPSDGTGLLALPGDLALATGVQRGQGLAIAHRGKTGDEVFRAALPLDAAKRGGAVVDERFVVFTTERAGQARRLILLDPPLAKGTVGAGSPARRELELAAPLVGAGVFGLRAAVGELFVATERELLRVGRGEGAAAVVWRKEVPFAGATALTVLDLEDLVYLGALGARGEEAVVLGYEVKGQDGAEIRELFRARVPLFPAAAAADAGIDAGAPGREPCDLALGRPDKALVVAWLCGPRSGVALLDAATGARSGLVHAVAPPPPAP